MDFRRMTLYITKIENRMSRKKLLFVFLVKIENMEMYIVIFWLEAENKKRICFG